MLPPLPPKAQHFQTVSFHLNKEYQHMLISVALILSPIRKVSSKHFIHCTANRANHFSPIILEEYCAIYGCCPAQNLKHVHTH